MNNSTRLKITEKTSAMLAYWDEHKICRYMNKASADWFGKKREDVIDKMNMQEFLGDVYLTNKPYIERVLAGETQVFERDFKIQSGEIRRGLVTYHPDIEHGAVKGFFVHVVELSTPADFHLSEAGDIIQQLQNDIEIKRKDPVMVEVAAYLRSEIFNGFPGLTLIAKKFHLSVSKLKRDFKTTYDTTPLIFFRNAQMNYAEIYSNENKVSKKELASILNFSNASNFSIYFKKFMDDIGRQRQQAIVKQKSEELHRLFIEQSPFAIAMFDNNMVYLAVSQQWLVDYGLQERQIIGKSNYEIYPETTEDFRRYHRECLQGKTHTCEEYYWKKKDGTVQWLTWDMRPWYTVNKEIGGILVYTQDITEKKKKELTHLRENYIFHKTSELAKIGTWERDLITGKVTWNQTVLDMLEIDEFRQSSLEENQVFYKEGESRDKIMAAVAEALQTGKPFDLKAEMVTAKQNIKWMRIIGMVEFTNGIASTLFGLFEELQ